MPLPDSTVLSLQVNSNAVQSKPKHAMIVRMSAETLDALADAFPNYPQMSFDFSDVPGIYIGESFFPMRPQRESSPHELYLRTASASKPMAPLKFYANVIGKFMVERQLGVKVTDKVRQQTMVAKQQHMERQAILLDQPPIHVPGKNGKRTIPGSGIVLKKKTAPSDQLHLASPSTHLSRKVSPLPQNPTPSKASSDVRRRLVHFLATAPRIADDVVRMVGGSITVAARKDLLALLHDVAEELPAKKGDSSPRSWQLKLQTWTEVRPFEWPKLTETDRIAMARQARMVFKALKIPESDPAWENVRYRSTASSVPAPPPMATSSSNRSSTSAQAESKRPAITTKEAKAKAKQDPPRAKGEIQMKDESTKATVSRINAIKRAEVERPPSPSEGSTAAKMAASRRLPGSGYQKKPSLPPAGATEKSATHVPAKSSLPASLPPKPSPAASPAGASHARKTIPTIPPKPPKKEDESDRERDMERERLRERERRKQEREKEREREREKERERQREKEKEKEKQREELERERAEIEKREKALARQRERDAIEREKRQREKEREREEMEQEKRRREKERLAKERAAAAAVQRKTATDDSHDNASSKASVPKRRKLDDGTSVPSSSSTARDAGLAGFKKQVHEPSVDPRLKMKKEQHSPQSSTSIQERRATSSASGSTHKSERPSKASGSIKPRRRSPIYTSSEDEGEIPQPRKRPSPPPVSDRSNSSDQPAERTQRHHRTPRAVYAPANDPAALRALYQSQYSDYIGTFSKIVAQKRKIQAMLNDSDAEVDVMDQDDLTKLSMEHKSLKKGLEDIQDMYNKGTMAASTARGGSGSTSD